MPFRPDTSGPVPSLRSDADRWQAVLDRNRGADGAFVYGVITTGVYCRPSCPSRRANRVNVRFYETPAEAEADGLRPCKRCTPSNTASGGGLAGRIATLRWTSILARLDDNGFAETGPLLTAEECARLTDRFDAGDGFRSHIIMARHGFGQGDYKYFDYPLPDLVAVLRTEVYARIAPLANLWAERLGAASGYPAKLDGMLARCHAAGQIRPTPLLLRYGPGDYNRLHQDLYGDHVFPVQLAILLNQPGEDFEGGEFVLTEQRPRMQSRATVIPLKRGEGVLFSVHHRPCAGARGHYRAIMRHGVSTIRDGRRHTLGIIFHDAA